jgi:hypothetical protein
MEAGMNRLALLAFCLLTVALPARADITVRQLYEDCRQGADRVSEAICLGYFTGFDMGFTLGGTVAARRANVPNKKVWCQPIGATFDAYIAVFRAWALRNAAHWDNTRAGFGVMAALAEAWPCSPGNQ